MSFTYTNAKRAFLRGEIDLQSDDIRVALVMTNTTADTEEDVTTMAGITTLDEMDGANYARKALANEAVSADNTDNEGVFDADDVSWTALGAGTRNVAGMVIYKHVTNDSDSIPLFYVDSGGFPFAANGGDVNVTWNAEGIFNLT